MIETRRFAAIMAIDVGYSRLMSLARRRRSFLPIERETGMVN